MGSGMAPGGAGIGGSNVGATVGVKGIAATVTCIFGRRTEGGDYRGDGGFGRGFRATSEEDGN